VRVVIKKRALNSLISLVNWIESQNTIGAGDKWQEDFFSTIENLARLKLEFTVCKSPDLAKWGYHCFTFKKKYIVAFKVNKEKFTVYRLILGSRLNY
jgi:plasmid stabilization system protein ParE